jgi:hypothetical protein
MRTVRSDYDAPMAEVKTARSVPAPHVIKLAIAAFALTVVALGIFAIR